MREFFAIFGALELLAIMDRLRQLLNAECPYRLPDELMDKFMDALTEVKLEPKEMLVPYGKMDDNVYIVKDGIIRYCYFDGDTEKTAGFAVPGTMMLQWHCYYMREPSVFQLEACGNSVVMKMSKNELERMIAGSLDFARWMLSMFAGQLYAYDRKTVVISGMADERFAALLENRPEIMNNVPLKIIASYLGVTPHYLSRLRKAFYGKK
jgi:CRP-like cAMP-binding protein